VIINSFGDLQMDSLFNVVLPVLAGGLSTLLMAGLKKLVAFIDNLPAIAQQLIVTVLSWGTVQLSLLLTVAFSSYDVTKLTSVDTLALSAAGLAFIFHKVKPKTV